MKVTSFLVSMVTQTQIKIFSGFYKPLTKRNCLIHVSVSLVSDSPCLTGTSSRWRTLPWITVTPRVTSSEFSTMKTSSWWSRRASGRKAKSKDLSISFHGSCMWPRLSTCQFTTLRPERGEPQMKRSNKSLSFIGFHYHWILLLMMFLFDVCPFFTNGSYISHFNKLSKHNIVYFCWFCAKIFLAHTSIACPRGWALAQLSETTKQQMNLE